MLEGKLTQINQEWMTISDSIIHQTGEYMQNQEMQEFQGRIEILSKELSSKSKQIQIISKEQKDLEDIEISAKELGLEAGQHQQDIMLLARKYDTVLQEKVNVYNELLESLKELVRRQKVFRKNQIDEAYLKNNSSILKRKLEQKERALKDS